MNITRRYTESGYPSYSMVLPTDTLYSLVVRAFIRRDYKYIVGWRDVKGYGLFLVYRADWQDDNSSLYYNPWWHG
jgi:hypothetical protein